MPRIVSRKLVRVATILLLSAATSVVAVSSSHAGMGIGPGAQGRVGPANPPGDSVIQKKKGSTGKSAPAAKGSGQPKGSSQPKGTTGKGPN